MSLPPEQIRIKRRRQEEPPEALYLDSEHPKRQRHSSDQQTYAFAFQRVRPGLQTSQSRTLAAVRARARNHGASRAISSYTTSTVPVVRVTTLDPDAKTTKPLEESKDHDAGSRRVPVQANQDQDGPAYNRTDAPTVTTGPEPRRFHLTKPTTNHKVSRNVTATNGVGLALFIERKVDSAVPGLQEVSRAYPEHESNVSDTTMEDFQSPARQRRRPRANVAEAKHLEEQRRVQAQIEIRKVGELASTAKEIQESNTNANEPSPNAQQILIDMAREDQGLLNMGQLREALEDSSMDYDSQDDFVYETYVRIPRDEVHQDPGLAKSIGFLVIEEEDKQLWETYAEDEGESEWDEEDGDSNAEDNPANEYPEEEVDYDDEYGYDAYKYRRSGSDEEEYDLENDDWGNEELEDRHYR